MISKKSSRADVPHAQRAKRLCAWLVIAAMQFEMAASAHAAISQLPLVSGAQPDVNVMFTLDNSTSMWDETLPESDEYSREGWHDTWASSTQANKFLITSALWRYYRSSAGNPLYYSPAARYMPWPRADRDQETMPAANPRAACFNRTGAVLPANPLTGCSVAGGTARNLQDEVVFTGGRYWPATYFRYRGATPLVQNGVSAQTNNVQANFEKVEIRPTVATYPRSAARTDCVAQANVCTYAEEIQNFANWFQYYRSRALMAKGAVAMAFSKQGNGLRVGFGSLHGTTQTVDGFSTRVVRRGVRKFEGTARQQFYELLYGTGNSSGTPLRFAVDQVGKYFERTGAGNPWAEDPSSASVGREFACRKSFHILSSDGYWNRDSEPAVTDVGNADNLTASGTGYNGKAPKKKNESVGRDFSNSDKIDRANPPADLDNPANPRGLTVDPLRDNHANQLSDFTSYYWRRDLRPDLDNIVPPSDRDPAYWQHLSTFTVGIGISGSGRIPQIATQASRDLAIEQASTIAWEPVTFDDSFDPRKGDDFVHASMSGRGRYFLASEPNAFAQDLAEALAEAQDQNFESAAVAVDSPQVVAGGLVYQPTYSPKRWYGRLYAFRPDPVTGDVDAQPAKAVWEASLQMPAPASRNIFTLDASTSPRLGKPFIWAGLSTAQRNSLNNDSNLLDYLRGDGSREIGRGGAFRTRSRYTFGGRTGGVLGDIVNSTPLKGPDFGGGYDRLPAGAERDSYFAYREGNVLVSMRNTIFVGANDGMMHAFDTDTGAERFAFVPNAVFDVPRSGPTGAPEKKLQMLADPGYAHRYTADGTPNVGDAYISGAWRAMLVSSNGLGARSVFALDVTDTAVSASGFGANKVMWEFSEADNVDMGFITGYPFVARMRNGAWAVIFGNGYDSTSGRAKLFILNASDGTLIREIDVGLPGGNGLSQPNLLLNSEREVIAIYAGDLKGQLWKFDVSATSAASWGAAFGGQPLFTARNDSGDTQPITVMPEISVHPSGGAILSFGTGKFFEREDTATGPENINLKTQSIYGIWDRPSATTGVGIGRGNLQRQTVGTSAFTGFDSTTRNPVDWQTRRGWYLDLDSGGERVHINPQQVDSVLFMVANRPEVVPCVSGGRGRLFALDPVTGGALKFGVFDANGAGGITQADAVGNVRVFTNGIATDPAFQRKVPSGDPPGGELMSRMSSPLSGQINGQRGGKELTARRSTNCQGIATVGLSDASIEADSVVTCGNAKARTSWRQLR
jgi:type IV pilus assembly protein PilY1